MGTPTDTTEVTAPDWYVNHFRGFGHTAEYLSETWSRLSDAARESYRRALSDSDERTLLGAGRPTIYGDYVAEAVASTSSQWHIQGTDPGQPDVALCGKRLTGALRTMRLHVSLLECPICMKMGGER